MRKLCLLSFVLAALGCQQPSEPGDDDTAPDDDTTPTGDGEVALGDANNYAFSGSLDIQSYPLAELGDPLFDWSGLTVDLQGHALDPVEDVDQVTVVVFRYLTEEEVEAKLSDNTLEQADIGLFATADPGDATSIHLSELTLLGNDIDVEQYFVDGYGTWLLSVASGTTPGVGTRMAAFLRPTPGETATTFEFADDSTVLEFTVDLTSLTRPEAPAGTAALTVDWSALTTDGQGNAFVAADVDRLLVGRYASMTAEELEARFLDLELIADGLWYLDLSGETQADLSGLQGELPFGGIDAEATWVLALQCTTCANPAPPFLTILTPVP